MRVGNEARRQGFAGHGKPVTRTTHELTVVVTAQDLCALKPDQALAWSGTVEKEVPLPDEVAAARRKLALFKDVSPTWV